MAGNSENAGNGHAAFLTRDDEMSLAEAKAAQTSESIPDTLEVHSDAMSVLQDSTDSMRKPARMIALVVGVGLLVIIGGSILSRVMRSSSAPQTQ